jgi:hypothetical protein
MNNEQLYKYIARCQEEFDTIDEEAPYEWKALGVLTFPSFVRPSRARQLFSRWLAEIRKSVGPHLVNWFAVSAHDRWNKVTRIHFLLGGSQISYQARWSVRWHDLSGGEAAISDYRPGAFVTHVLKNADAGQYFQVTMDLCGWGLLEIDDN